jgi:hypothetical protein
MVAFAPTDEQRNTVQAMAGYGIPQDDICTVILNHETGAPITSKTLRKAFPVELQTGATVANAKVAEALYKIATGNSPSAATACIFWMKTRLGWRETNRTELTGADGKPIETQTTELTEAERASRVAALFEGARIRKARHQAKGDDAGED